MSRIRIRIRLKILPAILCCIIIVSLYILIKFAALSFSDDMGQAGFVPAAVSKICSKAVEAGPSLISYTVKEENSSDTFVENILEDRFALNNFVSDTEPFRGNTQDYASMFRTFDTAAQTEVNPSEAPLYDGSEAAVEVSNTANIIGFYPMVSKYLSLEYILTNGAVMRSEITGELIWNENTSSDLLQIGYLNGEVSPEATDESAVSAEDSQIASVMGEAFTMEQLNDVAFLIHNFYFVDASTTVTDSLFDAGILLNKDMMMKQGNDAPQILIYHTHSQEDFADSRPGVEADTVVGAGEYFAQILREDYGYNVIHDKTYYDVIGEKGYDEAYTQAEKGITKILEENPTIEVVIDLHRDSGSAKSVFINGVETAQIMLFNGLCRDQNGPITNLDNPNLQDNLAFSLQIQMKSLELYPGFFRRNYLKSYRFNMHVRPKCLLVELGTEYNTVESAKNAMPPFAQVLDAVLKGDGLQIE